jgi:hypothetical protein
LSANSGFSLGESHAITEPKGKGQPSRDSDNEDVDWRIVGSEGSESSYGELIEDRVRVIIRAVYTLSLESSMFAAADRHQ